MIPLRPASRRILLGALVLVASVVLARAPGAAQAQIGSLDFRFGIGGVYLPPFSGPVVAYAVAALPDGGVAVTGAAARDGAEYDLYVARFTAEGGLVRGFGQGGVVAYSVTPGATDAGYAITGLADGRVLVAALTDRGGPHLALVSLLPDGGLDAGFGSGGIPVTPLAEGETVGAVAALADGRIMVAGRAVLGDGPGLRLARFQAEGTPDTSFGDGGVLVRPFAGAQGGLSLAATEGGGLVVAGGGIRAADGELVLATMWLTADGAPAPGSHEAQLGSQPDGLTATSLQPRAGGTADVVALYTEGGGRVLLAQADAGGRLHASGAASALARPVDSVRGVALARDGRMLVVGDDRGQVLVSRYQGFTGLPVTRPSATPVPSTPPPTPAPSAATPPPVATAPPPPPPTATATPTPPQGGAGQVLLAESMSGGGVLRLPSPLAGVQAEYSSAGYTLSIDGLSRDLLVLATAPGEYGDTATGVQFTVQRLDELQRIDVLVGCRLNAAATDGYVLVLVFAGSAGLPVTGARSPWQVAVLRLDGGRRTVLFPQTPSPALRPPAETNETELTCAGNSITATVNGQVVATVTDSTHRTGRSGIGGSLRDAEPASIRFRNLGIAQ